MALVPFARRNGGELARLRTGMGDWFDGFFRGLDRPFVAERMWPAIDVADRDGAIVVRVEVPGCKANDIDISIHGSTLTISGQKEETKEQKDKGYYHVESVYGSFRRDVELPAEVDPNKIEAVCKDGILSVTLPKTEKTKAVKIQVKG